MNLSKKWNNKKLAKIAFKGSTNDSEGVGMWYVILPSDLNSLHCEFRRFVDGNKHNTGTPHFIVFPR